MRIHDFKLPPAIAADPKWWLTTFLTCIEIRQNPTKIEFVGVLTAIGCTAFPAQLDCVVALAFWGIVGGEHEIVIKVNQSAEETELHREKIIIKHPPEEQELFWPLLIPAVTEGPVFLECYIDGQLLGRRALSFSLAAKPASSSEDKKHLEKISVDVLEIQRKQSDPALEKAPSKSALVYFSICGSCVSEGVYLKFEEEMTSLYWKSYPLKWKFFLATGFRLPKGKHEVRVELQNVFDGIKTEIGKTAAESSSSCKVTQIHGELIVAVLKSAFYFINLYVDNILIGSKIMVAETDKPQYMYNIPDEQKKEVSEGQCLVLAKRAINQAQSKVEQA